LCPSGQLLRCEQPLRVITFGVPLRLRDHPRSVRPDGGWRKGPDTLPWLRQCATTDSDGNVRRAAVQALATGWREDPDTLP
ncbi:MAG: HEAT repeat domain-containing protein, partial [Pseudonocardiaceae bacterium]